MHKFCSDIFCAKSENFEKCVIPGPEQIELLLLYTYIIERQLKQGPETLFLKWTLGLMARPIHFFKYKILK